MNVESKREGRGFGMRECQTDRPQMIYFDFLPGGKTREENGPFFRPKMNGRAVSAL